MTSSQSKNHFFSKRPLLSFQKKLETPTTLMSRSSSHKSEAFCSRTVCKDGGVFGHCIESGDDLVLLLVGFGREVWVCDDGRLSGPIFIVCPADAGSRRRCCSHLHGAVRLKSRCVRGSCFAYLSSKHWHTIVARVYMLVRCESDNLSLASKFSTAIKI